MVQLNDIHKVSLQIKEKFVVGRNYFQGKHFASFFVEAFLYVAMSSFAKLFSNIELGLEVYRIFGFGFELSLRVIWLLWLSLRRKIETNFLLGAFLLCNQSVDSIGGRVENGKDFEFGAYGGESVFLYSVIFIVGFHF